MAHATSDNVPISDISIDERSHGELIRQRMVDASGRVNSSARRRVVDCRRQVIAISQ